MRTSLRTLAMCGFVLAIAPVGVRAQLIPLTAFSDPSATPPKLRVFLADFEQEGASSAGVNLAELTRVLIRLDLLGTRGVQVQDAGSKGVPCASRPVSAAQSKVYVQPADEGRDASILPTVTISLHAVADSARVLLDVAVRRCTAGTMVLIKHEDKEIGKRDVLEDLLALVGSITRRVQDEIPRTTVAVRKFTTNLADTVSRAIAEDASDLVAERVGRLEDARFVEGPADTSADYRITGTVTFTGPRDVVSARVFITPRGSARPVDSTTVNISGREYGKIYNQVADSVLRRFDHVRQIAALGRSSRTAALNSTELEARARQALCIGAPPACVANPDAAVAQLRSAMATRHDAGLYVLLGLAESARGNSGQAAMAYRRALSVADSTAPTAAGVSAARNDALRGLIALLRDGGDNGAAVGLYDKLLALNPRDSIVARDRALNLRLAHRQLAALRALAQLDSAAPGWAQTSADFETAIADVRAEDIADSAQAIGDICSARPRLHSRCVRIVGEKAAQLASIEARSNRMRDLATTLIRISGDDLVRRSEGYAYVGASWLGTSTFIMNASGQVEHRVADTGNIRLAVEPLGVADSLARMGADTHTREWIARLRAQLYLNSRRYEDAYGSAMTALDLQATNAASLLATQAALMRGKEASNRHSDAEARMFNRRADAAVTPMVQAHLPSSYFFYREIKHALNQDTTARAVLEAIVRDTPADDEAPRVLDHLCIEYLKDYACALRTQRAAYQTGRLRSYDDSLNAVETAVVFGDYETGSTWLEPLLSRPARACQKAVGFLYATWIAAARANEPARIDSEARFREALAAHLGQGGRDCWLFEGAKAKLTGPAPPLSRGVRATLLDMIRSLEPPPRTPAT